MEMQDEHVIDVPSILAQELSTELTSLKPPSTELAGDGDPSPTPPIIIDEVGERTRNVDPHEYLPHHVYIGPYSRMRNADLAGDDDDKLRTLQELKDFVAELELLEARARSSYRHTFGVVPSKEFLRWLLLDACYILVRFGDVDDVVGRRPRPAAPAAVASANGAVQGGNRVVPSVERRRASAADRQYILDVVRDVFYLAANQVPFFVVERVRQMTFLDHGTPALDAIARFAGKLLEQKQYSVATPTMVGPPERRPEPANLLHLLHMHFTPTVLTSAAAVGGGGAPVGRWRTAMEYYFVGVKFKRRPLNRRSKGGALSILDVKVSGGGGGTLEVPQLNIDGETWRLLRNLIALEQSNPSGAGSHVTAYCVFMSQLASTPMDVELLSRRGVIVHGLGNNGEVAKRFADLCKGTVFDVDDADQNYLRPVCQVLDRRFQSRPRRWMAWLKQKYFANPWLAAGLAAAAVIFVCTVIQAVYSVLSYKKG
ncbi:hypothetical protein OsJ_27033 [Oryza sativa Japonica Group]|uniref:Uncharacterized protein n=1 Tax=Oryza sativa subsp. japonica TaxID=39947 RepID=A3BSC3_ORYSJ|nr:hypothetical protein OsJ_27033 [Oryza sativa Japonica Group]